MEIVIAVFLGLWQAGAAWLAWRRLRNEFGQDKRTQKEAGRE